MDFLPIAALFIFIIPIILITGLIKRIGKRSDFYEYILFSTGSVLLSILLFLGLYSWKKGQTVFDTVWSYFRQIFVNGPVNGSQMLDVYHQLGLFENFTTAGQLADFLIGQMKMMVPAAILLFSLIYGVFLFLIIRIIIRRLDSPVPVVPAFEHWTLPRRLFLGLILLFLGFFLVNALGIANVEAAQNTMTVLISFLFSITGLSVLWFFLKAGRVPSPLRWLIAIIVYLILGFALPVLGIVDQFIHLRIRYKNKFRTTNGGRKEL